MCAECAEDYCIGCFTRFHQKGALKLHRMIPIQTDLQTHVSAREVVRRFQNKIPPGPAPSTSANPNANPSPNSKSAPNQTYSSNSITRQGDQIPEKGPDVGAQYMQSPPEHSQEVSDVAVMQVSALQARQQSREKEVEALRRQIQDYQLLFASYFIFVCSPLPHISPVSVSAMATQADLAPVRGAEGGGRGEGSVPVRVEFTENSLTYIDRLLLKKHRRTPIKTYRPSSASGNDSKSQPNINTVEETASLTAQEEDFHRYCASLFADPVSSGRPEPQITQPESCLVIQVLDEREEEDIHGLSIAQQRTDNNRKVPSVQQPLSKGTLLTQTAIINSGSSLVSCSSPSPALPSRQFTAPTPAKGAKRLHLSRNQTSQPEHLTKSSSSKSKPSASPTAQTSKTSIKTQPSKKPNCPPKVHESKPDLGSIQHLSSPSPAHSQTQILKPSLSPVLFPPDASPVTVNRPPILEHHLSPSPSISFSLRSTFEVSPSSSTESILLPKVHQSTPIQKGSDVSLLPEQSQSSQLFPETISSPKLSQSFRSNQVSSRQSQHSRCDPESLLSDNQLQLPPGSCSSTTPPKYLALSPAVKYLSNESFVDAFSSHGQTPTTEDSSVFEYSTPISVDHESTLDRLPSHFMDGIQNYPLNVKLEEEEEEEVHCYQGDLKRHSSGQVK
ncbi:serine/arginine repetitive matrix protein 2 [Notothenia coriiceps]|uniref:Serine/arginine repetitive matrix protein 2 n=1 Tax=Notothenia coriiceps TaxID=8208 RepID=A0A6I9PBQ5_9TELE|nr:PREDICTED: zinc finger B-box domain-containing protein 1 [Notothenia coriiceps]